MDMAEVVGVGGGRVVGFGVEVGLEVFLEFLKWVGRVQRITPW